MQTLTIVTMPAPLRRCIALTVRGDAVVSRFHLRRQRRGMGTDERRTAVPEVRDLLEQMDVKASDKKVPGGWWAARHEEGVCARPHSRTSID